MTECSDCRKKTGVMARETGHGHYQLCATCADRRRSIRGQERASVPPAKLPGRQLHLEMEGEDE